MTTPTLTPKPSELKPKPKPDVIAELEQPVVTAPLPIAGLAKASADSTPSEAPVADEPASAEPKALSAGQKKRLKLKAKKAADAAGAEPEVAPELDKTQRWAHVKTLNEEDKTELAALWEMDETDPRFILGTTVEKSYKFLQGLTPLQRKCVGEEHVKSALAIGAKTWPLLRQAQASTLLESDKTELIAKWQIAPTDNRLKLVFDADRPQFYQYFSALPPAFMKIVTAAQIRARVPDSPAARKAAKEAREKIAKEAKDKLDQEIAAKKEKEAKEKHEQNKADFETYRNKLAADIAARLKAAGMEDFEWAAAFAASASKRGAVIEQNPTAKLATQTSGLKGEWDKRIDMEQKRRDVEKAVANHPDLKLSTRAEIKKDVLADDTLTVTDFENRCAAALQEQRNPDVATWSKWLGLKMFRSGQPKTMETLTGRLTFEVHFSVDEDGLTRPTNVTDVTTGEQLVDQLFRAPGGKMYEAHVTLETGVEDAQGKAKNPHKYWRPANAPYELYFANGASRRWNTAHSEAKIKEALDEAMAEIRARYVALAALALAKKGNL